MGRAVAAVDPPRQILIPPGAESSQFSASRIFAAAYPEAVALAGLIASPAWRSLAAATPPSSSSSPPRSAAAWLAGYQPAHTGDAIAQWVLYYSWRPPSRRHGAFPQPADTDRARTVRLSQAGRASNGTNAAPCGFSSTAVAAASPCTGRVTHHYDKACVEDPGKYCCLCRVGDYAMAADATEQTSTAGTVIAGTVYAGTIEQLGRKSDGSRRVVFRTSSSTFDTQWPGRNGLTRLRWPRSCTTSRSR